MRLSKLQNFYLFYLVSLLATWIVSVKANHNQLSADDAFNDNDNDNNNDDAYIDPHRNLDIIDTDNREVYTARKNGILYLETNNPAQKNCTVTLVHREIGVTDAHCVSQDLAWLDTARVHFNYKQGQTPTYTGKVTELYLAPSYGGFALVRVSPALGDVTGFMQINSMNIAKFKKANMVSHLFVSTAGVDYCCAVNGIQPSDNRIIHLCDGTNGAPLFVRQIMRNKNTKKINGEKYHLLGVQNGVVELDGAPLYNLAVPGKPILDLLNVMLKTVVPQPPFINLVWSSQVDPNACGLPTTKINNNPVRSPIKQPVPTPKPPTGTNPPNPTPKPPTGTNPPNPTPKPPTGTNPPNPTPKPPTGTNPPNPTPKPPTGTNPPNPTPKPPTGTNPPNPTPKPPTPKPPTPKPPTPTCKKNRLLTGDDGAGSGCGGDNENDSESDDENENEDNQGDNNEDRRLAATENEESRSPEYLRARLMRQVRRYRM